MIEKHTHSFQANEMQFLSTTGYWQTTKERKMDSRVVFKKTVTMKYKNKWKDHVQ
jgi:hypothetical protein